MFSCTYDLPKCYGFYFLQWDGEKGGLSSQRDWTSSELVRFIFISFKGQGHWLLLVGRGVAGFGYQFDESVHDGFAADANPAIARAVREGFQPPVPASSQPQPSFATPYNAPANQSGETTGSGSLSQRKAWGVHGNVHTLRQDDDEVSPKGNRYWNGNSTQFGGDDDSKEDWVQQLWWWVKFSGCDDVTHWHHELLGKSWVQLSVFKTTS